MIANHRPLQVVVLVSGRGSNLQALLDAAQQPGAPFRIRAVISDQTDALALSRAATAGVATCCIPATRGETRASYDARLRDELDRLDTGLVALAGFMRILGPEFVFAFAGRLLNIHPSLLPRHPGLATHERAIAAGDRYHGATVHFVSAEVDAGAPVLQARLCVFPWDTPASLAARVLHGEHRIYPRAVEWVARGRLHWRDGTAYFDGRPLLGPRILTTDGWA